jgi:rhomboid protease GluP
VQLLIGGCSILFIVSVVLSPGALQPRGLMNLFSPDTRTLFLLGASGALPVYGLGHVWTLLSASWLHGGLLHIFFNMMWVRQLAGPVAGLYGAGRMILIWTASSIVGFGLRALFCRRFRFSGPTLPSPSVPPPRSSGFWGRWSATAARRGNARCTSRSGPGRS